MNDNPVLAGSGLDIDLLVRVAQGRGDVSLTEEARARVAAARSTTAREAATRSRASAASDTSAVPCATCASKSMSSPLPVSTVAPLMRRTLAVIRPE